MDDEEEEIGVDDLRGMTRRELLRTANAVGQDIPDKIRRGSTEVIRRYLIVTLFDDLNDDSIDELEDVTTKELVKSLLESPDRIKYTDLIIQGFPALRKMQRDLDSIEPMLVSLCRTLEEYDVPLPDEAAQWWHERKEAQQALIADRVKELQRKIVEARMAQDELDELLGKRKVVRKIRRIVMPR